MALLSGVLSLRNDGRLLRIPPYLSALCIIIGIAWLMLLPLDEYSRHTYVSENAILPGQVHTYFGGSEHNIFRAYRQEAWAATEYSEDKRSDTFSDILSSQGLKTAIQNYTYEVAGQKKSGQNVYAVLQGPRADATEAMVLMAAWRNMDDAINYSGVALVLTLARYFKRWSIWSKDIIIIIPGDSTFGPQAWVDAYHDTHDPATVSSLGIKAGALQAALAVDYPAGPWGQRFEKLHVVYDGVNGQLPNLDLVNTAVNIANGQIGIDCAIQHMLNRNDDYPARLETMLKGMLSQALGHASGPHSSFMPYHIDAITLQAVGDGWHDEMSLGRVVESLLRSVNNLLEHLHQSFFFYLLMHSKRFVSIGTYLPSAMLVAINFAITSILLWVMSGKPAETTPEPGSTQSDEKRPDMTLIKQGGDMALVPTKSLEIVERDLFTPLTIVFASHVLGLLPLYLFNQIPDKSSPTTSAALLASTALTPLLLALTLTHVVHATRQNMQLTHCLSLLLLSAALSTLATLNFSQALFIGLLASPLSFIRPFAPPKSLPVAAKAGLGFLCVAAVVAVSPPAVLLVASHLSGRHWPDLLAAAAWAWEVEGVWTAVTVWIVWWPAWVCGGVVLLGGMV